MSSRHHAVFHQVAGVSKIVAICLLSGATHLQADPPDNARGRTSRTGDDSSGLQQLKSRKPPQGPTLEEIAERVANRPLCEPLWDEYFIEVETGEPTRTVTKETDALGRSRRTDSGWQRGKTTATELAPSGALCGLVEAFADHSTGFGSGESPERRSFFRFPPEFPAVENTLKQKLSEAESDQSRALAEALLKCYEDCKGVFGPLANSESRERTLRPADRKLLIAHARLRELTLWQYK